MLRSWTDRKALLFLTALVFLYFWPLVLHPGEILYSPWSDLWAEHIPAKQFLASSLQQTGELPLWCPYLYSGSPLIHDIQVATFYPFHWPLYSLPPSWIGPGLSWLVVLHVLLAGWLMYAYARHSQMSIFGSLLAAIGYMFAGRWMMHLLGGGHYITIGLAWLPMVLLCLEKATGSSRLLPSASNKGGLFWATLSGLGYALMILSTHIQWTFYSGLFIALWTLGAISDRACFRRWLGYGIWTVALAVALTTVQLGPTWIASQQSLRSQGMAPETMHDSLRLWETIIGPEQQAFPFHLQWENRGGLALLWLLAAAAAPFLTNRKSRYYAILALGLILFSGGGSFLLKPLPGFNLFRQPTRMMLIAAFPIALLAGRTIDVLAEEGASSRSRRICFWVWLVAGSALLLVSLSRSLILFSQGIAQSFHIYWVMAPPALIGALILLKRDHSQRKLLWLLLMVTDLWALSWPVVDVRPEKEVFAPSESLRYLIRHRHRGRIFDGYCYDTERGSLWLGSPLGQGAPLAPVHRLEAVRGYNPLDKKHYREYLQLITDEEKPLKGLTGPLAHPVLGKMPLVNRSLLDLLHVRYVLLPEGEVPPGPKWRACHYDPQPVAFNIYLGGRQKLSPYVIYENQQMLPRAFVVPQAKPLPERKKLLKILKETNFKETVFLNGYSNNSQPRSTEFHAATVRHFSPNRIEIQAESKGGGFLVLSENWYPGWQCKRNGIPVPIYRANVTFRAIQLPPGKHKVVFTFEPPSYRIGQWLSGISLLLTLVILGMGIFRRA